MASRVLLAHPPFDEGLGRDFNVSDFRVVGFAYNMFTVYGFVVSNFSELFLSDFRLRGSGIQGGGAVKNKAQGYDAEGLAFRASGSAISPQKFRMRAQLQNHYTRTTKQ